MIGYSLAIVSGTKIIYLSSKAIDDQVPIHLEVLLPAFILGCTMTRPAGAELYRDNAREGHQEGPESTAEQRVATIASGGIHAIVGLSMASVFAALGVSSSATTTITNEHAIPEWSVRIMYVIAITLLANLGKLFPAVCYRRQASWRECLALAIGMWPSGEVGAGVLIGSISWGISGAIFAVAALSLALNLVLRSVFI